MKNRGVALQYASEELKGDKEFILETVKENGNALGYASEEFRGDKEVVLEAVKNNGVALQYASEELKGDKEFILETVKENGNALEYASEEFRGDKEVVLEAVKNNEKALKYASKELKNDRDFMGKIAEVVEYPYDTILEEADNQLKENEEFMSEIAKKTKKLLLFDQYEYIELDVNDLVNNNDNKVKEVLKKLEKTATEFAIDFYAGYDEDAYIWTEGFMKAKIGEILEFKSLYEKDNNKKINETKNNKGTLDKDEELNNLMKTDQNLDETIKIAEKVVQDLGKQNNKGISQSDE